MQRNKSIRNYAQDKDIAEATYKQLVDLKTKIPNAKCISMCAELHIDLNKIMQMKLE